MLGLTAHEAIRDTRDNNKVIPCRGYYRLRALTATHTVRSAAALFMMEKAEAWCLIIVLECIAAFGIAFVGFPTA